VKMIFISILNPKYKDKKAVPRAASGYARQLNIS